ncbi:MAG: VWA domain-containing protein [Blastocatellia bacterium]
MSALIRAVRPLLCLLVICLAVPGQTRPQRPPAAKSPKPAVKPTPAPPTGESAKADADASDQPPLSIKTNEVLLPVTVRDAMGRFVPGLKPEAFTILEDGIRQEISSFAQQRLPVHVLLMIDTSSSVQREIEDFKSAALEFANRLGPDDSLSLIRFDDRIELVQDWTTSRQALRRAMGRLGSGVFTRFHDAMVLAARDQLRQVHGRRAVIVFTDGVDSQRGRTGPAAALRALVEAEAPVYVISKARIQQRMHLQELDYYEQNPSGTDIQTTRIKLALEALASAEKHLVNMVDQTGGRLFLPQRFEQLADIYQEVADELQNQYVIFYTPSNQQRDNRFRATRVKIDCGACHATTRFGYYPR